MKNIFLNFNSICFLVLFLICSNSVLSKEFQSKSGKASFSVFAPARTINGESSAVKIKFNVETKQIVVEVPVRSFQFTNNFDGQEYNDMVTKRFNEHYMNSKDYPMVRYIGDVINIHDINFNKDGVYPVKTKGKLTIAQGIQEHEIEGKLTVKNGEIWIHAEVKVYPLKHKLPVPKYIGSLYLGEVKVITVAKLE